MAVEMLFFVYSMQSNTLDVWSKKFCEIVRVNFQCDLHYLANLQNRISVMAKDQL